MDKLPQIFRVSQDYEPPEDKDYLMIYRSKGKLRFRGVFSNKFVESTDTYNNIDEIGKYCQELAAKHGLKRIMDRPG